MKRLLTTILSVAFCIAVSAQGICVINGAIADVKCAGGEKVKKVFLVRANEAGQVETVAESKVKKGKYTFEYRLAKDEPVLMYMITGFGEDQGIEVFVEPGEVAVNTASAAQPCGSVVTGTPTNDEYSAFKAVLDDRCKTAEERPVESQKYRESIKTLSGAIRFLIDHNASPMTPLAIERYLLHLLTPAYAEQMLKSVSTTLENHPYYLSLRNKVLAGNLKVGNEAPDIALPMLGGERKLLSDFRGKYVVLNFWTDGCEKSTSMIEELKNLHGVIKESNGEFIIVSFLLATDKAAWAVAVENNGMNLDGWLHACDGVGTESPAAKLLGVDKAPRIVLIEPEGRVVSLDMDIDEVVMRVEQILSGDLYYLDQEE
ncbi:MAG: DUF4369 domain-containing protein [Bacteroidaceae bacterium]|nr:DUF4369 domain-containing protein [Bacteroidaceae bacterium]